MSINEAAGRIVYWLTWPGLKLFLQRTTRTRALIEHNDEIVVTKSWLGNGKWSLPGGGVKRGESVEDALIREIKEEVGLIVTKGQLSKRANMTYRQNGIEFSFLLFDVSIAHKLAVRPDRSEVIHAQWIKIKELSSRNASSDVLQAIAQMKQ